MHLEANGLQVAIETSKFSIAMEECHRLLTTARDIVTTRTPSSIFVCLSVQVHYGKPIETLSCI